MSSVAADGSKGVVSKDVVSNDAVLFDELSAGADFKLGLMTLNVPAAMNAVDLDMVNLIDDGIRRWNEDPQIAAIIMRGAGDKAFCAGGDIRKLYTSMTCDDERQRLQYADDFFRGEYAKNYRLHQITKPLIAWGHGFVMGGGLGLFIAANHRVGSECLKLAWPEVRIGLYPDVAASYYLSRLPYPAGHWMGLTGSHMNTTDCKQLGLIQYALEHNRWQDFIQRMQQAHWCTNKAVNHQQVRQLLTELDSASAGQMPVSDMQAVAAELDEIFASDDIADICVRLKQHKSRNKWLKQGQQNFKKACPATVHLIMEQIRRGATMSLKEVVSWELILAYQAVRHPDFSEGVRAMVVDKDYKPKWQHKSVAAVPDSWLKQLMTSPWPADQHPYREL